MKAWMRVVLLVSLGALLVGCTAAGPMAVTSADEVQRINPEEAKALQDSGEAVLYDTRSAESYRLQHAAGAISFPEEELGARFDELPDSKDLIFYCT